MPNKTASKKRILQRVGSFFKDFFTKNIPLKIISLLFAIMLWGYVLTIENPEYPKVVRDVEITMTGESTLTERGLTLVSRELGTTDVTVQCVIGKHSELDASRITCSVDLSDRALTLSDDEMSKIVPLTVSASIRSGYGTITSVENSTVSVEIARVSTRTGIPVSVEYTGALPAGFRVSTPDRLTVTVSGMQSQVDRIAKGVVSIDLSAFPRADLEALAGEYSGVYSIQFLDSSNNPVENVYDDSGDSYTLDVPITIRAYREATIEPEIAVPDGYEYTYTLSRRYITLYGDRAALDAIDTIVTEPISALPGMTGETVTAQLVLPEGITTGSGDTDSVTVTLTVSERIETRTLSVPIVVKGLDSSLLRGEDFPTEAAVSAKGTVKKLDAFTTANLTVTADLTGYGAGTHTIPLQISVDTHAEGIAAELVQPSITVTLLEKSAE